jgi:hypothetical protein
MGLATKRRNGGNGPPRAKTGGRVKEKRYEDARERKRPPRRALSTAPNPSPKRRRFLDPTALALGMTARGIGARTHLTCLTPDEIERDLRHMEAYANACTSYAQQFFIFHNRALVQSGQFGPVTAPAVASTENYVNGEAFDPFRRTLPVRIDPEEEKRVLLLRKRIAASESQREILETEYMSLRAHYVYESQRLRRTRHAVDGQLTVLQDLVRRRGAVVALRRVRCAVARDILAALERRTAALAQGKSLGHESKPGSPDIFEVWNEIEDLLREAEKLCRAVTIPEDLALLRSDSRGKKKKDKKNQSGDEEEERVVSWDCRKMPAAPEAIPTLLSQMSSNPERVAAWSKLKTLFWKIATAISPDIVIGCGGMFGSKHSSMCWDTASLPRSCGKMSSEHDELLRLREEAQFLQDELENERATNKGLQLKIIGKRTRNDEMCAMMTLLRSETEAVLMRHNILLETKEAKGAAQEIHNKTLDEREHRADGVAELVDEDKRGKVDSHEGAQRDGKHDSIHHEEHDNDGDDEGEMDEEEEEDGEINDEPPNEVVINKSENVEEMT